jgi:hypothetical protein
MWDVNMKYNSITYIYNIIYIYNKIKLH